MPMEAAHIWPLAPEEGPCTQDTTDPPGSTGIILAQEGQAAPRSQRFLTQLQIKCQTEMRLYSIRPLCNI